eukprot:TRINITY_DN568_c0_g1_i1.p1 TRINITY_DN568_c0_g1~~TRINITY_DN568_c0_g1_i1.p1  ORF type:complete len:413 (+),score=128.39 TRINITY_DN568_c0_g1_i1:61-1299(+)
MSLPSAMSSQVAEERLLDPAIESTFSDVFRAYQHVAGPLLAYCDAVMGADSPFVLGEKFLIAAFTSRVVDCETCQRVHENAAITFGVDEALVDRLYEDIDSSPIAPRLKPVFHFARKVALSPKDVTNDDHQSLFNHGWSKRAIFDVTAIVGLFKGMACIVQGMYLRVPEELCQNTGVTLGQGGFRTLAAMHDVTAPYAPPSSDEVVSKARFPGKKSGLLPGQRVTLVGLSKEQHNGKKGTVLEYVPHAGNWRVELNNAVVIRVAAENCVVENPLSAFVESSDEEYPPVSETPSSSQAPTTPTTAPLHVTSDVPENPINRKMTLARSRFGRVQDRLTKEYAAAPILESVEVDTHDKTETLYFKINAKWDKGRKALFAKAYTRLYKDGQRKLRVLILDKADQDKGHSVACSDSE